MSAQALCECGHPRAKHRPGCWALGSGPSGWCHCTAFRPAPAPQPEPTGLLERVDAVLDGDVAAGDLRRLAAEIEAGQSDG